MPHQCVHCGKIIEPSSREILEGCNNCGSKFFFYIRDEEMPVEQPVEEFKQLASEEKKQVENDVRRIMGMEHDDRPVILDLESIKVIKPGKFEIDLVGLMNRKPIVFKLEEGKYMIDLDSIGKEK
ncbi:MAG: Zn-ribbon domain-containing protein [Candidatus Nanoarchaeia archaeon]